MKNKIWMLTALFMLAIGQASAAEKITYYHLDALGSPIAATDENGQLAWKEAYKPYGERIRKEDGGSNSTWYTGKQEDEDNGLTYFGARWYDPAVGRFMGIDPVGVMEDNVHSFNRYAYANNNPYKFVDPDGRTPVHAIGAIAYGIFKAGKLAYNAYKSSKATRAAAERLRANKAAGEAFEQQVKVRLKQTQTNVVEQVTVKTQSGVRTRIDILGRDAKGAIKCTECKSSSTATLTKNQKLAFPEIQQSGGVVVGKGKPGFRGGTKIPPTKVDIVRPN